MDERRGEQQAAGSHPPIASAGSVLPPAQQAYGDYATHFTGCRDCRDIDLGPCSEGDRLHRAWRRLSDAAMDRVARKAN